MSCEDFVLETTTSSITYWKCIRYENLQNHNKTKQNRKKHWPLYRVSLRRCRPHKKKYNHCCSLLNLQCVVVCT